MRACLAVLAPQDVKGCLVCGASLPTTQHGCQGVRGGRLPTVYTVHGPAPGVLCYRECRSIECGSKHYATYVEVGKGGDKYVYNSFGSAAYFVSTAQTVLAMELLADADQSIVHMNAPFRAYEAKYNEEHAYGCVTLAVGCLCFVCTATDPADPHGLTTPGTSPHGTRRVAPRPRQRTATPPPHSSPPAGACSPASRWRRPSCGTPLCASSRWTVRARC